MPSRSGWIGTSPRGNGESMSRGHRGSGRDAGEDRGRSEARLPDFLVVAAPRAGTTSLHRYLDAHPQVFMAPQKEVHFFDQHHHRGPDWYRQQFAEAEPRQVVGDATPTYLFAPGAVERMAELLPDAKLIVVLRNPVDRAYSNYWYWRTMFPDGRSFAELARAEMADPEAPAAEGFQPYLAMGRYLPQLRHLMDHYPRKALLVLLLEDLKEDAASAFRSVCCFLDIREDTVPKEVGRTFNPAPRLRSEQLRRAMLRTRAWRWLPNRLVNGIDRLNRRPAPYPPMDPALRNELLDWYREDNEALARWLGRDLSMWNV